jgi:hypothetical protein
MPAPSHRHSGDDLSRLPIAARHLVSGDVARDQPRQNACQSMGLAAEKESAAQQLGRIERPQRPRHFETSSRADEMLAPMAIVTNWPWTGPSAARGRPGPPFDELLSGWRRPTTRSAVGDEAPVGRYGDLKNAVDRRNEKSYYIVIWRNVPLRG